MDDDVQAIELRRLTELQKQAALTGPHTPPHVLIEIQDIQNRYPHVRPRRADRAYSVLDYDFLMNTVAAALERITKIEQHGLAERDSRVNRQLLHDAWMIAITVIALVNLVLLLTR
jgi:hypothetical protein